jgi:hypothetical protein
MAHALSARPIASVRNLTVTLVSVWFALALIGSLLGVFDSEPRPPIMLGLAAVAPVVIFMFGYLTSLRFQEFVLGLDLRILTLAQTWRVGGIVFLMLYKQAALPGIFAIPAGWGDIVIGITAPVVAWYWKPPFPAKAFIVWNLLGCLDLLMAVSLGVLASASALGVLAGNGNTGIMGHFPLSLIPTFVVPLLLIFHLICMIRVRKETA